METTDPQFAADACCDRSRKMHWSQATTVLILRSRGNQFFNAVRSDGLCSTSMGRLGIRAGHGCLLPFPLLPPPPFPPWPLGPPLLL
jgi:hypothetical protein